MQQQHRRNGVAIYSTEGLFDALESGTATLKKVDGSLEIPLVCAFTERQKAILKCGGLLPYTKTV
mgnify:CR=1 FL=1